MSARTVVWPALVLTVIIVVAVGSGDRPATARGARGGRAPFSSSGGCARGQRAAWGVGESVATSGGVHGTGRVAARRCATVRGGSLLPPLTARTHLAVSSPVVVGSLKSSRARGLRQDVCVADAASKLGSAARGCPRLNRRGGLRAAKRHSLAWYSYPFFTCFDCVAVGRAALRQRTTTSDCALRGAATWAARARVLVAVAGLLTHRAYPSLAPTCVGELRCPRAP